MSTRGTRAAAPTPPATAWTAATARAARRFRPLGERRGTPGDRGQVAVEFLGFLPVLLAIGLAVVQLGIAAFAVQQAGTGARAAARAATLDHPVDPAAAGRGSMTGWVADRARVSGVPCAGGAASCTATVTVGIPSIVPGIGGFGHVTRRATMPMPPPDTGVLP